MTNQPKVDQYLTKTQIYEKFGRHSRTLTEDIRKAIARGDKELLALAQLRTHDGEVVEGIDVTADTWKELTDNGDNPTWFLLPEFVDVVKKRKARTRTQRRKPESKQAKAPIGEDAEKHSRESRISDAVSRPPIPTDPDVRAVVLEHIHYLDQKHAAENKVLLDRILTLVETNQQLQGQTNTLFNQMQEVIKDGEVAKSTNLVATRPTTSTSHAKPSPVADIEIVETKESSSSKPEKTSPKASGKSNPKRKVTKTKKRSAKNASKKQSPKSIWKMPVSDITKRFFG